MTLGYILNAVKLSFSFIEKKVEQVSFQLYAPLMNAEESCCMKGYLRDIAVNAPRPWLKPCSECFTSVLNETTIDLCE